MATFTRHLGRRVSGVAVLAILMLIAAATPAFAVQPTITTFSPASGPAGCVVTVNGTNFQNPNVTGVTIGGDAQAFVIVSGTVLRVTVDAGAVTGLIVVDNGLQATSASNFTISSPGACSPTITGFSPTSGPVGTAVNISGTNLLGVTSVEFFNGQSASFSETTSTQLGAFVPPSAQTGPITVTTAVGTVSSLTNFTVGTGPVPTITSFLPTSGPVGTSVVITGTNFTGATGVSFNNVAASAFTVNSATQITATVPTGATTGPIRVTTPNGVGVSGTSFTVTTAPTPTITSFTPAFGKVGTTVTITGTNFSGTGFTTSAVKFNGVAATSFTVNSATQITATVPSTATTGKITLTTPGGTATSTNNFVVSTQHARTVSLNLNRHIIARGQVSAGGFAACEASVVVKIQRMRSGGGGWKTVDTDTTSSTGAYKVNLSDKEGRYRAKAPRVVLGGGADICSADASPSRNHPH